MWTEELFIYRNQNEYCKVRIKDDKISVFPMFDVTTESMIGAAILKITLARQYNVT